MDISENCLSEAWGMKEKAKIIMELEGDLKQYDFVLLCVPDDEGNVLQLLCESGIFKNTGTNFKVYVPTSFNIHVNENSRVISEQEMDCILEYYRMYEFSNRFKVLEDSEQYGGFINYLRNGILTEEEVFEAILSKKG